MRSWTVKSLIYWDLKLVILLPLLGLPLAAQSLTLSCPPRKPNQPTVCPIMFTGSAVSIQWKLSSVPPVNFTVTSSTAGKSISGNKGLYMLIGMNKTPLTGRIATLTLPGMPPHSTGPVLTLSGALGVNAGGHAVNVGPAVTLSVP